MDRQSLAFHAAQEAGRVLLTVTGELDMSTADALYQQATGLIDEETRQLVLDLGEVSFCDSLGLAALVRIYHYGNARGCPLRLINVRGHVGLVLQISGLDQIFEIEPG
jgi:anti-sigma B factor antagonist